MAPPIIMTHNNKITFHQNQKVRPTQFGVYFQDGLSSIGSPLVRLAILDLHYYLQFSVHHY